MHISEGVLSAPVLVAGAAVAAAGTAMGLKKIEMGQVPKVAVLSSVFFVASLIHVPIGLSSAHLVLNGMTGLLLGWAAFPAIMVALFLQAVLFQFGGLTTLGVNTVSMALPAVVCFYLFNRQVRNGSRSALLGGFACGFLAVLLSSLMVALFLVRTEESFLLPAKLIIVAHLPIMVVEGMITAFIAGFLKKVSPEMLEVAHAET